jgi:hypothetical protein
MCNGTIDFAKGINAFRAEALIFAKGIRAFTLKALIVLRAFMHLL